MQVNYLNGTADLGNELSPTQVRNEPTVSWPVMSNTSAALYTIIMTDPDAPSRSNRSLADVKHWIVGNILGNDVSTGETIAEYIGAAPHLGQDITAMFFWCTSKQSALITRWSPEAQIGGSF